MIPDFGSAQAQAARFMGLWQQQALLASEAAMVISARLWLIALSDPRAAAESRRMVDEKVEALGQVWWALARAQGEALWQGRALPSPEMQTNRAVRMYRRKVRANLRRLNR